MVSPTNNSKPTGHGYSKKKKNPKPKPNLKTDGSKPNPWMAAKTEIRNGETELITSAQWRLQEFCLGCSYSTLKKFQVIPIYFKCFGKYWPKFKIWPA